MGQAVAGEHEIHAEVPFAKVPIGHVDIVKSQDEAPCVLYEPALHGKHAADVFAPVATENVPAAQGVQEELIAAPTTAL